MYIAALVAIPCVLGGYISRSEPASPYAQMRPYAMLVVITNNCVTVAQMDNLPAGCRLINVGARESFRVMVQDGLSQNANVGIMGR